MDDFKYTGTDSLEVMLDAKNYNASLVSLILNIKPQKTDRLLDIGAGIGLFAEMLTKKAYKIDCMELDSTQASLLEKKGFWVTTSIENVPDNSYDLIYALNVLEHIEDDKESLSLWAKKLKPGGKLFVYVPAFNVLFSSMDRKVGHFRRYRRKGLTEVVTKSGLTPMYSARYSDSLVFFASLFYKWINDGSGDVSKQGLIFYDRILYPISKIGDVFFKKLFGKNVYIAAEKTK